MMADADLGTIEGLTTAVERGSQFDRRAKELGPWDGTFCSRCGERRRMVLQRLHAGDDWTPTPRRGEHGRPLRSTFDLHEPSLFAALCLQCDGVLTLVVYCGPDGAALVALPSSYGGLATPNTPDGVAYYLDQAQRAQAVGALSGAVAMYRAALEHLLQEQGYTSGMLGKRIDTLLNDPNPPAWRDQLDPDYLSAINRLGNAAIHANDGDIKQQAVFDAELLLEVRELFVELLDDVYEQPAKKASRLARLQQAAASVRR
jgi:hypothetical protein